MEIFGFILLLIGGICGIIYTCIIVAKSRIELWKWLYDDNTHNTHNNRKKEKEHEKK